MKQIIFFIVLTIGIQISKAQIPVPSPEQIQQFLKTTTCVVYDANPMVTYNLTIKRNFLSKNHPNSPFLL